MNRMKTVWLAAVSALLCRKSVNSLQLSSIAYSSMLKRSYGHGRTLGRRFSSDSTSGTAGTGVTDGGSSSKFLISVEGNIGAGIVLMLQWIFLVIANIIVVQIALGCDGWLAGW